MNEEEFEILLSRLAWDDLDAEGRDELARELRESPEHAKRHDRFIETMAVLDGLGSETLEIPELEKEYGLDAAVSPSDAPAIDKKGSGGKLLRGNFARVALPAAAAVLISLAGWYLFAPTGSTEPGAFVTHASGECRSGAVLQKAGQRLAGTQARTGKDSTCDIRIAYSGMLHLRLLADSHVSYSMHNDSLTIKLEKGELLLQSEKLPARGKLRIHSPGHSVEILGTRIALNRRADHRLHMELIRGRAKVTSAHYLRLHGLRNGVHEKHRAGLAREFPELFREQEHILEPGRGLRFEHHVDFKKHTAPMFRKLEAHLRGVPHTGSRSGERHVPRKLHGKLKAVYISYPHLRDHLAAPPGPGRSLQLSNERHARLRAHFDGISSNAAAHDRRR